MRGPSNPGGYTREEIGTLDPWWVQNIILCPRDKHGNVVISPKPRESECSSIEEFFRRKLEQLLVPEHKIWKLWRKYAKVIPRQPAPGRTYVPIEE